MVVVVVKVVVVKVVVVVVAVVGGEGFESKSGRRLNWKYSCQSTVAQNDANLNREKRLKEKIKQDAAHTILLPEQEVVIPEQISGDCASEMDTAEGPHQPSRAGQQESSDSDVQGFSGPNPPLPEAPPFRALFGGESACAAFTRVFSNTL